MRKYFVFTVLLFLVLLPSIVKASCSDSEMIRLQRIANNVNISYLFDENKNRFDIYITNLKKDIEFKDLNNNKVYNTDGEIVISDAYSGKHTYHIYSKNKDCGTYPLSSKYLNILFYNPYYKNNECKNFSDKYYCSKWIKNNINYNQWYSFVSKYELKNDEVKKEKNNTFLYQTIKKIQEFYNKYYYIILPLFIGIIMIFIYINYRRNRLV